MSAIEKGVRAINRRMGRSTDDVRRLLRSSKELQDRMKVMKAEIVGLQVSESEMRADIIALRNRVTALESG